MTTTPALQRWWLAALAWLVLPAPLFLQNSQAQAVTRKDDGAVEWAFGRGASSCTLDRVLHLESVRALLCHLPTPSSSHCPPDTR